MTSDVRRILERIARWLARPRPLPVPDPAPFVWDDEEQAVSTADYRIVRHKGNKPGESPSFATYGRTFDAQGQELCVTLERPWVDDDGLDRDGDGVGDGDGKRDRNESRFVPGLYRLFLRKSYLNGGDGKRKYDVWQFEGVADIDAAQVHIANLPHELEGCVAVGAAFGEVNGQPGITGSKNAHDKWMKDTLALCARERRDHIWVEVVDAFTD